MFKMETLFLFFFLKGEFNKVIWRYVQLITAGWDLQKITPFIMCFSYALVGVPILYT